MRTVPGGTPTPLVKVAAPTAESPKLQNAHPLVVFSMLMSLFDGSPCGLPGSNVAALVVVVAATDTGVDCSMPVVLFPNSGVKGFGHTYCTEEGRLVIPKLPFAGRATLNSTATEPVEMPVLSELHTKLSVSAADT